MCVTSKNIKEFISIIYIPLCSHIYIYSALLLVTPLLNYMNLLQIEKLVQQKIKKRRKIPRQALHKWRRRMWNYMDVCMKRMRSFLVRQWKMTVISFYFVLYFTVLLYNAFVWNFLNLWLSMSVCLSLIFLYSFSKKKEGI